MADNPDLAAIKAREAMLRAAIARGDAAVDVGAFNMAQLGLRSVVADEFGRLWRVDGSTLVLMSGPHYGQAGLKCYACFRIDHFELAVEKIFWRESDAKRWVELNDDEFIQAQYKMVEID